MKFPITIEHREADAFWKDLKLRGISREEDIQEISSPEELLGRYLENTDIPCKVTDADGVSEFFNIADQEEFDQLLEE